MRIAFFTFALIAGIGVVAGHVDGEARSLFGHVADWLDVVGSVTASPPNVR
ncbi:MAG TPA: hypothetical protein VF342_15965 [Alphaproteobacteria bacterium]